MDIFYFMIMPLFDLSLKSLSYFIMFNFIFSFLFYI